MTVMNVNSLICKLNCIYSNGHILYNNGSRRTEKVYVWSACLVFIN